MSLMALGFSFLIRKATGAREQHMGCSHRRPVECQSPRTGHRPRGVSLCTLLPRTRDSETQTRATPRNAAPCLYTRACCPFGWMFTSRNLHASRLDSLDGFVFALNQEGKFLYISETVSIYLGLSQVELTGSSVFDYVHPGDHVEMAEQLGMKLPPGRGLLSQGTAEDGASSASSSSQSETPEPGGN
ncbi:hypoxia-inducible factor 1-alpha-like [Lontra canadensis]|uniref:hypoxia-inducible factor 1-alpha-like n=1 Tax=Lontra canadensis TaxID=76717 RepID=UPI0013F37A0F|nr:hypoxia-inducible factor 1-alpha-like [Lontra canadensis]